MCVCVLCILTTATIRGWRLFPSELPIVRLLFEGGDYLRTASIQRNTIYTKIHYDDFKCNYCTCVIPKLEFTHVAMILILEYDVDFFSTVSV